MGSLEVWPPPMGTSRRGGVGRAERGAGVSSCVVRITGGAGEGCSAAGGAMLVAEVRSRRPRRVRQAYKSLGVSSGGKRVRGRGT